MDELPYVLQKEIWEYVRGDRAHWRQEFDLVIFELGRVHPRAHLRVAKELYTGNHLRHLDGGCDIQVAHEKMANQWHVSHGPCGWVEPSSSHDSLAEAICEFQQLVTEFQRIQFCGQNLDD
jgi:hypothetical protein